jgi:hypothetical protein
MAVTVIRAIRPEITAVHFQYEPPIGMLRNGKVLAWVSRETPLRTDLWYNVVADFIKIDFVGRGAGVGGGICQK